MLKDNVMVMASEVGVYDTDPANVVFKVPPIFKLSALHNKQKHLQILTSINVPKNFQSRLKPGRMLLVDTKEKKIIGDVELKKEIALSRPHSEWLHEQVCRKFLLLSYF